VVNFINIIANIKCKMRRKMVKEVVRKDGEEGRE
jgi:hypothetical protein